MNRQLFADALAFADRQCRKLIAAHPGYAPMYTVGGKWNCEGERWTHWCEGFYPGVFWLLHKHTGAPFWRDHAEAYSRVLEPRRFDRDVHDLGFLFFSTYLRWYRLTGDAALRDVLVDAGRTMALRRQAGGYLRSFVAPESLFIDIMMNVGIVLWAANVLEDETLRQIGIEHCRTTQRTIVRPDGGTAHEGIFDVCTGKFLNESTHQGYRPESTWSRGLAWSLYGFAAAHRLTGLPEFLETARRNADCFLRRSPPDRVPPWDFDAPADRPQPPDSSAGAIAASGLLDLAEQEPDPNQAQRFRAAAEAMLETLCMKCLADQHPEWDGILLHGTYHLHKRLGVDESVAWGDHFFVEALAKALAGQSAAGW